MKNKIEVSSNFTGTNGMEFCSLPKNFIQVGNLKMFQNGSLSSKNKNVNIAKTKAPVLKSLKIFSPLQQMN